MIRSGALEREHALRNAMNVLELSLSLAKRALVEGDIAHAADFVERAEQACTQCRNLLGVPSAAASTASRKRG